MVMEINMRSNKNIGMKSEDNNNKEIASGITELNSDLNNINKEKMVEKNEIVKNIAYRELDDDVFDMNRSIISAHLSALAYCDGYYRSVHIKYVII